MSVLILASITCMPLISEAMVVPYISNMYTLLEPSQGATLVQAYIGLTVDMNTYIFNGFVVVCMAIVLFVGLGRKNNKKQADIYLAGAAIDSDKRIYQGSMGKKVEATAKN